MTNLQVGLVILFGLGYLAIALEHQLKLSKTVAAVLCGVALWVAGAALGNLHVSAELTAGIADLLLLLIFAMSIVEILVRVRFFDWVKYGIEKIGFGVKGTFALVGVLTFLLSAVIDNLTTTIIFVVLLKRLVKDRALVLFAVFVVIAANAGGAWSPIGDVTTIMLWLSGRFQELDIVAWGILPSLAMVLVGGGLVLRELQGVKFELTLGGEKPAPATWAEVTLMVAGFASFNLPFIMLRALGLPPWLGLAAGFGLLTLLLRVTHAEEHASDFDQHLIKIMAKVDWQAIVFFLGILMAVGALEASGVLHAVASWVYSDPGVLRLILANAGIGLASAIVDNIALTAAVDAVAPGSKALWILLALAVGNGGSLLSIGSAAGVVAVSRINLSFLGYAKVALVPVLAGYSAMLAVWLAEYVLWR